MTRSGLALAGLVIVAVIANAALSAFRAERGTRSPEVQVFASTASRTVQQQGETVPAPTTEPASEHLTATQVVPVNVGPASVVPQKASPSAAAVGGVAPAQGMALKVPAGRTELRDSMYVERGGDSAVVHFDTEMARTRRRDKFEATVRTTLPALYGARVESTLATIPDGDIMGDRDLASDVATSGVKLVIPSGGTLDLLPVTRPGRDGPLVVGYRVRVTP